MARGDSLTLTLATLGAFLASAAFTAAIWLNSYYANQAKVEADHVAHILSQTAADGKYAKAADAELLVLANQLLAQQKAGDQTQAAITQRLIDELQGVCRSNCGVVVSHPTQGTPTTPGSTTTTTTPPSSPKPPKPRVVPPPTTSLLQWLASLLSPLVSGK